MLEFGPLGTRKFRGTEVIRSMKNPNLFFTYRFAIFSCYVSTYLLLLDQSAVLVVARKEFENKVCEKQQVDYKVSYI